MVNNIGIVIIGRNEGKLLTKCIDSVLKTHKPCVYVDSQSTDESVGIAVLRKVKVHVIDSSMALSAARARNEGFKVLTHHHPGLKYVHFIDGDCEIDIEWPDKAVKYLSDNADVAVVCGRLHEKYKNKNIYTRLCDMDWYIEPGNIVSCGGIATIRRDVFETLKGFNATLISGEEAELSNRIRKAGYTLYCLTADMGTHDSDMESFYQFWQRSIKTGYAYCYNKDIWGGKKKQYNSSIYWGGIVPVILLILFIFFGWYGVLGGLVYPAQMIRIFYKYDRRDVSTKNKLIYASFCVIGKFSEFIGIIKYHLGYILKSPIGGP